MCETNWIGMVKLYLTRLSSSCVMVSRLDKFRLGLSQLSSNRLRSHRVNSISFISDSTKTTWVSPSQLDQVYLGLDQVSSSILVVTLGRFNHSDGNHLRAIKLEFTPCVDR